MIYCRIEGCTGKHEGLGFCKKHYQRFIKYGDPLFTKFSKERKQKEQTSMITLPTRYNYKPIEFDELNGCFICTSHVYKGQRYAHMRIQGKQWGVHRWIYTQCFGEIPKGYVIMHTCDNPKCINPEHLVLGTQADNMFDMCKKGRHRNGATKEMERIAESI